MSGIKQYDTETRLEAVMGTNHYGSHVHAMTAEKLHSKSDIAVELAWRDMKISDLLAKLEAAEKEIHDLRMKLSDAGCLLVEWKQRVEKADKERDELEMSLNVANDATGIWKGRAEAAEARLLVPVKLPESVIVNISGKYPIDVMYVSRVKKAISAAGYPVEGGE